MPDHATFSLVSVSAGFLVTLAFAPSLSSDASSTTHVGSSQIPLYLPSEYPVMISLLYALLCKLQEGVLVSSFSERLGSLPTQYCGCLIWVLVSSAAVGLRVQVDAISS